jgi:hypothetical protein
MDISGANTRDLTLFLDVILFDFNIYENIEVDICLATLLQHPAQTHRLTSGEVETIGAMGRHRHITAGELILAPNSLGYALVVEGYPFYVSALGVLDGRLHMQLYGGKYIAAFPILQAPDGTHLEETFALGFQLNDEGVFKPMRYMDEYGNWIWVGENNYWEFVFEPDLENLHEYRLIFKYFVRQNMVTLNKSVSFELQDVGGIPRIPVPVQPSRAEMLVGREAIDYAIFGDMPREIDVFDGSGELAGTVTIGLRSITSSGPTTPLGGRGEIHDFEIRVGFNDFETGVFIFCIREEPELIPPELYDQIMYYASHAFALEARRGQRIEYFVPETIPLRILAMEIQNNLFENVFCDELPRVLRFYDSNGHEEAVISAGFGRPESPESSEDLHLSQFEMTVRFRENAYPYIALCVREDYDLIPPQWRDIVMREAELRFAHWENFKNNTDYGELISTSTTSPVLILTYTS